MIIAVANTKGGVGKTTTAVALAVCASREGRTVTVYDADPQGSATGWFEEAEEAGEHLGDILIGCEAANVRTIRAMPRTYSGGGRRVAIIDCPPASGTVDAAVEVSDAVIIPTAPANLDVQQAWRVVDVCRARGIPYAVLVTCARRTTKSLGALIDTFEAEGVSYFSTVIPLREDLAQRYGHAFGRDMYGYAEVWDEFKQSMGME